MKLSSLVARSLVAVLAASACAGPPVQALPPVAPKSVERAFALRPSPGPGPADPFADGVLWLRFDRAFELSQQTDRPILVYFHSASCPFCVRMLDGSWSDPRVGRMVARLFVPSMEDADVSSMAVTLGITSFPHVVVGRSTGCGGLSIHGYASAERLLKALPMIRQMSDERCRQQAPEATGPGSAGLELLPVTAARTGA